LLWGKKMSNSNFGYLFYKDVFRKMDLRKVENKEKQKKINKHNFKVLEYDKDSGRKGFNQIFFNKKLPSPDKIEPYFSNFIKNFGINRKFFELETTYPGLLTGSGYNHEVGGINEELKLGFFFDHTTGLPCIPGSSVKGVLRDACTKDDGKYILSIIAELKSGSERKAIKDELKIKDIAVSFYEDIEKKQSLFMKKEKGKNGIEKILPSEFVKAVFIGEGISVYKRDIFFDAFPIESLNKNGKFLANDYITHHKDPLKNPIQFLKILPQVVFQFDFKLTNTGMNKELKLELFRQILLDLGIGAKTAVGYGYFK